MQFDVIARLDEEEKRIIRELIGGMILKYQARRWAGAPSKEASSAKRKVHAASR